MKALLIVDMLEDFVDGALANPRARQIVAPIRRLLEHVGQHTHICVRHTAYGALIRGYAIVVPRDAVCAFEGVDEDAALEYLRSVYGARETTVEELVHPLPVPSASS